MEIANFKVNNCVIALYKICLQPKAKVNWLQFGVLCYLIGVLSKSPLLLFYCEGGGVGHSSDTAKKRVPISQHVWHDKDLYLLNDRRCVEYRPNFCGFIEKKVNVNRYI